MLNLAAKLSSRKSAFPAAVLGVLILGFAWKVLLLARNAFPFNADEAIVGLMGRHIMAGARPIFFYGQAYMGSLDAFMVAAAFQIFGVEVQTIRLVQILLYLGTVLTTIRIAYDLHQDRVAALISGLLLALPTINFTLYTTVSLGGYGEAILIGNLLILLTLDLRKAGGGPGRHFWWGMLAGLGFWSFGLSIIYILPCAWVIGVGRIKRKSRRSSQGFYLLLLGLAIGLSPLIFWITRNGASVVLDELLGSAIAGSSPDNLLQAVWQHLQNLLLFGLTVILGFRAPWSTEPMSIPLLPFAFLFWGLTLLHAIFRHRRQGGTDGLAILTASSGLLLLGFILTPFGADPSGRYFIPLAIPLAILAGEFVRHPLINIHRTLRWLLLGGVLAFQVHSNWWAATQQPDRITTQFDPIARIDERSLGTLISFLSSHDLTRGYTNYWVAYPLAFQSDEQIIFYPALPYHGDFRFSARDNRYPRYQELVEESTEVAFITTKHEALDESLRDSFSELDLTWDEVLVGDYRVFYNLSKPVDIEKIGAAWLTPDPSS